jgi:PhoH-like ATPase
MTTTKTFVLDTNILLHNPKSIYSFGDNEVVIPLDALLELDNFKKDMSELGRSAREVARSLDALRANGSLADGVELPSGGTLRVVPTLDDIPTELGGMSLMDNRILSVALAEQLDKPDDTYFITKDINLRIRADSLGLIAEDYESDKVDASELYTGYTESLVSSDVVDSMYSKGVNAGWEPESGTYLPNQFVFMRDEANPSHTSVGRYDLGKNRVVPILKINPKEGVWGIRPRNVEQNYALDLLLNDDIKLVTIVGKAGTGKTLMAIAAGLQKVTEDSTYQKLLVARPVVPMGKGTGFLPGTLQEKLEVWMQPIFDNVEFLLNVGKQERKAGRGAQELVDLGIIEVCSLEHIRGRTLPNQMLIVDEAQNLTPLELKTIITRAGEGCKIVLTGDVDQIDNPYIDASSNGLAYVVNKLKNERISGHITLTKGERSELAEIASNIL